MRDDDDGFAGESIVATALRTALTIVNDRSNVMERLVARARADGHRRTAESFEAERMKCEKLRDTIEYALSIIPVGCAVCRSEQAGSNYGR